MKNTLSSNSATYDPQHYKCFAGALEAFFEQECPQLGGTRTRQVLVKAILDMVLKFYPESTHMKQGQVQWVTVDKDEKSSYGKSIKNTRLKSVILDLVQETDAKDRSKGKKLRDIKREAVTRLLKQAYEQGGCLTNAEVAILLKISPGTVGNYVKSWEVENEEVLPRRGTIHDIGPSLTHKKIIIRKLFVEKKQVPDVCRETCHSERAVQRYIEKFQQILLCKKKGMTSEEIEYAVKITSRLLKEYEEIIDEYKEEGYLEEMLTSSKNCNESDKLMK